jgi:acyl-CoA thioesterase FadM
MGTISSFWKTDVRPSAKKYGFDYLSFYNKGFAAPIVHVSCDYRKSLKYRDIALIEANFQERQMQQKSFSIM